MNKDYAELNCNEYKYIVFDQDDKVSLVNSKFDISKILNFENDLEKLKKDLDECLKIINNISIGEKNRKLFRRGITIFELSMILVFLLFSLGLSMLTFFSIYVFIIGSMIDKFAFGDKNNNENILYKKELEKQILLAKIDSTEISLKKEKEKSQFEKKELNQIVSENTYFDILNTDSLTDAPRVKKLIKLPNNKSQ